MWDRPRRSPAASSTRSTSSRQAHPMPSPLRPSVLAVIVSCAAAFAGSGCDNTITSAEALPPLEMASLDSNAGSWRMIVLSGPTQFTVAAPAAETSAAYAVELAAIRTAQANLTAAQRNSIAFWAGGGVLRWNQIERELVARFNLPPAPRPRSEEHTSELQSPCNLVCRLLLEKKKQSGRDARPGVGSSDYARCRVSDVCRLRPPPPYSSSDSRTYDPPHVQSLCATTLFALAVA